MTRADKLLLLAYIDAKVALEAGKTQPWVFAAPEFASLKESTAQMREAFLTSPDTLSATRFQSFAKCGTSIANVAAFADFERERATTSPEKP